MLPCVVACALWARSDLTADGWSWSDGVRVPTAGYQVAWRKALLVRDGRVVFFADRSMGGTAHRRRIDAAAGEVAYQIHAGPPAGPGGTGWAFLGFEHVSRHGYPMIASTRLGPPVELTRVRVVPLWAAAAVTATVPIWRVAARRRRQTRPGGFPIEPSGRDGISAPHP